MLAFVISGSKEITMTKRIGTALIPEHGKKWIGSGASLDNGPARVGDAVSVKVDVEIEFQVEVVAIENRDIYGVI